MASVELVSSFADGGGGGLELGLPFSFSFSSSFFDVCTRDVEGMVCRLGFDVACKDGEGGTMTIGAVSMEIGGGGFRCEGDRLGWSEWEGERWLWAASPRCVEAVLDVGFKEEDRLWLLLPRLREIIVLPTPSS